MNLRQIYHRVSTPTRFAVLSACAHLDMARTPGLPGRRRRVRLQIDGLFGSTTKYHFFRIREYAYTERYRQ